MALTRQLVVSPHLDDGVLSLGGSIHDWVSDGDQVTILTLFAGTSQENPAGNSLLARQLAIWGIRRYDERQDEDVVAAGIVGASVRHVDLPELLLREGDTNSIDELLSRVPCLELADRVADVVASAAADHDVTYLPSGRSGHPDHVVVAGSASRLSGVRVAFYEEIPYCLAHRPEFEPSRFTCASLAAKVDAVACYRSQVPVLFGGFAEMRAAVTGRARGFGVGYAEGVRYVDESVRPGTPSRHGGEHR